MKIALISDTHIDISSGHIVQKHNIDRFFSWFWEHMERLNISHVFHLGDIVDNRQRISFAGVQQLKECIFQPVKRLGVEFHGIVGNHDCSSRTNNDVSSAFLFENKKGVRVYTSPKEVTLPDGTVIAMVPWINRENQQEVTEFLDKTEAKIVMGHLEVKGALMMRGTVNDHGQDSNLFSKFQSVFSGHFHHKNSYGNIHYIGNICQFTWGDHGEQRGFSIYDTETGVLEFYENPFSPFQKIYYNDEKDNYEDLSFMDGKDYQNLLIKIIVVEKKNPYHLDRFAQKLSECGAFSVQIIEHDSVEYSGDEVQTEDIKEFKADTLTILENYVTKTSLSEEQTKRVATLLKELYAEASSRSIHS